MKKFFIFFITLMLLSSSCFAWGPFVHFSKFQKAMDDDSIQSPVKDKILANYDACLAGIEAPDVGVIYYYTNFKAYQSLHDWNYQQKLLELASNDAEETFAICYGIHLVQDTVSHNFFVPDRIRSTKIPNALIHPVVELKIDPLYQDPRASHVMDKFDAYVHLMNEASGDKEWGQEGSILRTAIGGENFYDDGFAPGEETTYFKLLSGTMDFLAKFDLEDSTVDYDARLDKATKDYLMGTIPVFDPSGADALRSADQNANVWKWVLGIALLISLFILTRRYKLW
jgi:hypothetical protein